MTLSLFQRVTPPNLEGRRKGVAQQDVEEYVAVCNCPSQGSGLP